jgi:DNA-binding CsgD family transcriptional regulator
MTPTIHSTRRLKLNASVTGGGPELTHRLSLPARGRFGLVVHRPEDDEANHALICDVEYLPAGRVPGDCWAAGAVIPDELTLAERRVLRYLPTNLTAREIGDELCLSVNTVKTHIRHIYAKLDAHRRHQAVEHARAFGLLAAWPDRRSDGRNRRPERPRRAVRQWSATNVEAEASRHPDPRRPT